MNSPTRTKYQKFETREINRTSIKEAPYNPRVISESAEKKLRAVIKDTGLLSTLVWNQRTGNLVSGHQRLHQLDALEKYPEKNPDYLLTVAAVDLDEKEEARMVVFFNNPSTQGDYDLNLLREISESLDLDYKNMGFTDSDIAFMFNPEAAALFEDTDEVKAAKAVLGDIKDARGEGKAKMTDDGNAGFFFTVVCESETQKRDIMARLGVAPYDKFVDAAFIIRLLPKKNIPKKPDK